MKKNLKRRGTSEIRSLNDMVLRVSDNLGLEEIEARLALAVGAFGGDSAASANECGHFTCVGFIDTLPTAG